MALMVPKEAKETADCAFLSLSQLSMGKCGRPLLNQSDGQFRLRQSIQLAIRATGRHVEYT